MIDLLTNTNDLTIVNDDLLTGYSNEQHQEHLLIFEPGTLIEDETVGIDAIGYLNGEDFEGLLNKTTEQFTNDGIEINEISFNEQSGELFTDGNYKN